MLAIREEKMEHNHDVTKKPRCWKDFTPNRVILRKKTNPCLILCWSKKHCSCCMLLKNIQTRFAFAKSYCIHWRPNILTRGRKIRQAFFFFSLHTPLYSFSVSRFLFSDAWKGKKSQRDMEMVLTHANGPRESGRQGTLGVGKRCFHTVL